eukprot:10006937-Alexandrium_andersonii.AAC.1
MYVIRSASLGALGPTATPPTLRCRHWRACPHPSAEMGLSGEREREREMQREGERERDAERGRA